jgi:hypothetical protein
MLLDANRGARRGFFICICYMDGKVVIIALTGSFIAFFLRRRESQVNNNSQLPVISHRLEPAIRKRLNEHVRTCGNRIGHKPLKGDSSSRRYNHEGIIFNYRLLSTIPPAKRNQPIHTIVKTLPATPPRRALRYSTR